MQKTKKKEEGAKEGKKAQQNQQIKKNKNVKIMLCSINLKTETRVEHVEQRREGENEGKWGKGLRTGEGKLKYLSR